MTFAEALGLIMLVGMVLVIFIGTYRDLVLEEQIPDEKASGEKADGPTVRRPERILCAVSARQWLRARCGQ